MELDDSYITIPSTIPFSSLTSHLEYSAENEEESNILGYVCYEYQGIEVGRAALRLVSAPLTGNSTDLNTGSDTESSPALETQNEAAPVQDSPRVITINVWHLGGYIFLAVLAFLLISLFIRFYSPRQRRKRRARKMRRIYTSDEHRRRKKHRELR